MARVNLNGAAINYETNGEGPAMVLLHANPFDHSMWLYQMPRFSAWYQVIALDLRGYGGSERTTECSLEIMAKDVARLCGKLGIDKCILAGVSVGGQIALQFAVDFPELLSALIVVGCVPSGRDLEQVFVQRIEGYRREGIPTYYEKHLRALVSNEFQESEIGRYLVDMFLEKAPTLRVEPIAAIFESVKQWSVKEDIHRIKTPTLLIGGEKDGALPGVRQIHSLMPEARFAIIPGAGHACCMGAPATFDCIVMEFLRDHGLMEPRVNTRIGT